MNVSGEGGLEHLEDEDKPAPSYVLGETTWGPLGVLCRSLRQGGAGELRMRRLPPLPKDEAGKNGSDFATVSAQLSMMLSKARGEEALRHCLVQADLERVVPPLAGPGDPRWEGAAVIVQERFRAEQLLERGDEGSALVRLRRVVAWVGQLPEQEAASMRAELAAARTTIGWILVCRAAPVLDSGSVTSDLIAVARRDLAEAEEHCAWLEQHCPHSEGFHLLRAKILVAQDDDFAGAHRHLLEAQKAAPSDRRVQEEMQRVKLELRKVEEEQNRAKVVGIRDNLKRARTEKSAEEAVLALLRELAATRISWETVMETRIGVELKSCQEDCGEDARRLCCEILGRLKDESKEQRPMWES